MTRRDLFAALASLPFAVRGFVRPSRTVRSDWQVHGDGWSAVRWKASPAEWKWCAKPKFEIVDGVLYASRERP